MAIDYGGAASLRTPIEGLEVTPAGWFFLLCFVAARFGRQAGELFDAARGRESDVADSE